MKKTSLFLLSLVLLFSCSKPETECTTSVASISGSYNITAYSYKESASSPETDYYPVLFPDACERDDVLTFNVNGTYQKTDERVVCSPPENDNGTWALSGNTMTVNGDLNTIESFDCKTLVVVSTDFLIPGDKLKITLIRQ